MKKKRTKTPTFTRSTIKKRDRRYSRSCFVSFSAGRVLTEYTITVKYKQLPIKPALLADSMTNNLNSVKS